MRFDQIIYGTNYYKDTLRLREKVMRIPLGLTIYDEDLSQEKDSYILGAFSQKNLLGFGVLSKTTWPFEFKVEFLCVDNEIQTKGIGSEILSRLEKRARLKGASSIILEARSSAEKFYAKYGYVAISQPYCMETAPIPHKKMKKQLDMV